MKKQNEEKNKVQKGVEWHRREIIEMVNKITRLDFLVKIYSFVKVFFDE
ncbi:MAG: hypothetical protein HFI75_08620 [Lachnospiraceae bacterium]|nr:hypothetical protein [Lachnospiraceae bacterium]